MSEETNVLKVTGSLLGRRYALPYGQCSFCDKHRDDSMMPPHTASARCESGKRDHCTCDICF